jgi:hypothetical protein
MTDSVLYWDKNVPSDLIPAVTHIRKSFEDADWKTRWTTQAWCHAALHPDQKDKTAEAEDYRSALDFLKSTIGPSALLLFQDLIRKGTPSAILKAFFLMYETALGAEIKSCFKDLLEVANANERRISGTPIDWAVWHCDAIIRSAAYQTAGWLKRCCDVQPFIANDSSDENWEWRRWQAPRFVGMQPSLGLPYDPSCAWSREDIETSLHLADAFKEYFIISLESDVKRCAGEAHVDLAKRSKPQPEMPQKEQSAGKGRPEARPSTKWTADRISDLPIEDQKRYKAIFGAIDARKEGPLYCAHLDDLKIPLLKVWSAGRFKGYAEAYKQDSTIRKKIQDEKNRFNEKYRGLTPAERTKIIN